MLLGVSVENYKSFDEKAELSFISSSKIQANKSHRVKIKQTCVLKNAVVYGANASGKSNLIKAISFIKKALLEGLTIDSCLDFCRKEESNAERESSFELRFTVGDSFYAYGFSAILKERKVKEEWLYELLQDGSSKKLFLREGGDAPSLGEGVALPPSEKARFEVYASDFLSHDSSLFLAEMGRGKRYEEDSKLLFFKKCFDWINRGIVLFLPGASPAENDAYYSEESLESVSALIKTFDTGVSEVKTRKITLDEMERLVGKEALEKICAELRRKFSSDPSAKPRMTWRSEKAFFAISLNEAGEAEARSLVLKHPRSFFDFSFAEESDGTKRLFDLIDMLLDGREDVLFAVDELERSLHPKLTERFLRLFLEAHASDRCQLLFATHEAASMDQELFRRDEIWFVERDEEKGSRLYSLDRFKERYDKRLSKAYLEGRYGAVPIFKSFSFGKD